MQPPRLLPATLLAALALGCASGRDGSAAEPAASRSPEDPRATTTPPPPAKEGTGRDADEPGGRIRLNGEEVTVRWSDGDSFRFTGGPWKGAGVRLTGYNSLESYGPVHRWGSWTAAELYEIARGGKDVGAATAWNCRSDGKQDGYGRVLVDCPDLAVEMLRRGIGHVYAIDEEPAAPLLAAQREAQDARRGIWKKGIPSRIVTSVHSAAEGKGYLRLVDARTGRSTVQDSTAIYATCQEVCSGDADDASCLVYVPFEKRYRDRPPCLLP